MDEEDTLESLLNYNVPTKIVRLLMKANKHRKMKSWIFEGLIDEEFILARSEFETGLRPEMRKDLIKLIRKWGNDCVMRGILKSIQIKKITDKYAYTSYSNVFFFDDSRVNQLALEYYADHIPGAKKMKNINYLGGKNKCVFHSKKVFKTLCEQLKYCI